MGAAPTLDGALNPALMVLAQRGEYVDLRGFCRASFSWLGIPGDVPLRGRIRDLWSDLLEALRQCPRVSFSHLSAVLSDDERLADLMLASDPLTQTLLVGHLRHDIELLMCLRKTMSARSLAVCLSSGPPTAGPHARRVLALALDRRLFGAPE